MPGAQLQLAAYGAQDVYLTGNPQMTNFMAIYKRHTNFAMETIEQLFVGEATFGKKVFCTLERSGDLVGSIYVNIKLPNLYKTFCVNDKYEPLQILGWINKIGHAIIDTYDIEIGGNKIDKQYGLWLEIWSELTVPCCKKDAYNMITGRNEFNNTIHNQGEMNLRIPLRFWFNNNIGLALPLIALQYHQVKINISFKKFEDVFTKISHIPMDKYLLKCKNIKFLNAWLDVEYYFLDDEERKIFAQNEHRYLIEQLQINTFSFRPNIGNYKETDDDNIIKIISTFYPTLDFNHPVKELIWVLQRKVILEDNDWFNFSISTNPDDLDLNVDEFQGDILESATLQLEGNERFSKKDAHYFRIIQPMQHHTNVPDNYIYVYSFALKPESHQPSGTCNFSRIDKANLLLNLKTIINTYYSVEENTYDNEISLTVFAKNYNILKIMNGMAGVAYSN
tara:strand:- start:316 stop:1665 length:1350 start_codon:yes stop_codon:yes gene_type:complete